MIDEYFSSNPQAKWAAIAFLAVYTWFVVIGPFMKLFTYDPNKDQGLEQSRSRWFLQLLIGLVPLVLVGYNWYKASHQPPPPPVEKPFDFGEFESTEWSIVMNQETKEAVYYHRENYEKGYIIPVE